MAKSTRLPLAIRHVLCLLFLAVSFLSGPAVHAQGIESIMAPGKLMQDHAKYEDDCKQCHVKFDRKAQDGRAWGVTRMSARTCVGKAAFMVV